MSEESIDGSSELQEIEGEADSSMLELVDVWDSSREPFDEWVKDVSRAFYDSKFGIEAAAKLLDTSAGELAAVLSLATIDDEGLEMLAKDVPPKTTWFTLADASPEEMEAGLEALNSRSDNDSPHAAVKHAIREIRGPKPDEKVAELPGDVFFHMASKAKQYDILSGRARGFLFEMGKVRSGDYDMSPKQAAWACDLFEEMADKGAITRDSPDDDQEKCDKVLDALNR